MGAPPRIVLCGFGPHLDRFWAGEAGRSSDPGSSRLEVVLGDEDIPYPAPQVLATRQGWVVCDSGGTRTTLVNGYPTGPGPLPLRAGDVVQWGHLVLTINVPVDVTTLPPSPDPSLTIQAVAHRSWEEAVDALGRYDLTRLPRAGHILALFRAGYHLRHLDSLQEFLRAGLDDAVAALGAQRGCIVLADELTGRLGEPAACAALAGVTPPSTYSRSLATRALERCESLLCRDADAAAAAAGQSIRLKGMSSVICALLRSPRGPLGVLHLDRGPLQEPFGEDEFFLADALAASLAAGIESARLLAGQRDLFLQTVTTLARAVELRDQYTGSHTQRVTDYALMLAEELKLPAAERQHLKVGTPLHDVGKIGVSDAILQKPGRLSAAEFEVMKAHTVKGAVMLEGVPGLRPLLPIVRHHHERWDGAGYPDGLAGEAIPPVARVVAVADAFDAMTSARPYRPALPWAQAFAEIGAKAGSQFAPECAAAFLRLRPRIEGMRA